MTESLVDAFGIGNHELVAFVGGGGKSTLALRLGRELADRGHPLVLTTTTKMGTSQIPDWATTCHTAAEVRAVLAGGSPAFLVGSTDGEKVIGVEPEVVDAVHAATGATVVVEADGARRRPFKAPGPGEPVIPASTTLVVVVVGADAVGGTIADVCHRPERVAALTARSFDDVVRVEDVAAVVTHPEGGRKHVPAGARHMVALTKVPADRANAARHLADLIAPTPLVTVPAAPPV